VSRTGTDPGRFDLVSVGEALIDMTPMGSTENGTPLYAANAGGGPANLAVAFARLGGSTAFVGQVGDDFFGHRLAATLAAEGIDTTGLVHTGNYHTTLAFVHLFDGGDRDFTFYRNPGADEMLTRDTLRYDVIGRSRALHFSSLVFTNEIALAATLEAAAFARSHGTLVSYDPNWRPMLWAEKDEGREALRRGIPLADIVKATPEELELLTGTANESASADRLFASGVRILLVTRGPDGCTVMTRDGREDVPGIPVTAGDGTGAGDAILGAYLFDLLRTMEASDLRVAELSSLPLRELGRIARFANAAAALKVSRYGGIPAMPRKPELDAFIAAHTGEVYR
jgi:fructokinase